MKALLFIILLTGLPILLVHAQWGVPTPADTLRSVRISEDGVVTFSIYAPEAKQVTLGGYVATENSLLLLFAMNWVYGVFPCQD